MPYNTLQHYLLHLLERNDQHILTSTEGSLDTVQVPLLCCPMEGLHWVFVHLVGLCNPPLLPCLIYSSAQHYIMGEVINHVSTSSLYGSCANFSLYKFCEVTRQLPCSFTNL